MQEPLPIRWKVFRIANYLYLAALAVMSVVILYFIFNFGINSLSDVVQMSITILGIALFFSNGIFNLYFLDRCYPDKPAGKGFIIISLIVMIISVLLTLLLSVLFVSGIYFFFSGRRTINSLGVITFIAMAIMLINSFFICWMQVTLKKTIARNHRQAMENFLNTAE